MEFHGVPVIADSEQYHKMLKKYEHIHDRGLYDAHRPPPTEPGTYIITGNRTADHGGGPSPSGFLHDEDGHFIGRVQLH